MTEEQKIDCSCPACGTSDFDGYCSWCKHKADKGKSWYTDKPVELKKKFIISYRDEFSTVIEAKNFDDAISKAKEKPWVYQWKCMGELHTDFFQHVTDHLTEDELYALQD